MITVPQTVFFDTKDFYIERRLSKNTMSYMHHHNTYEIYYTLSGERDYFVENTFLKAYEGDFVLIPKNNLHRTAGKGADRILIYFSDSFLEAYFSKKMIAELLGGFEAKIFHPDEEQQKKSRALLSALLSGYCAQCDETLLAAYLFELLFLLSHEENQAKMRSSSDSRINQILSYINENYDKISCIDEIADRFYISKYHLCRSFSKELNLSLVTYLNTVKIRAACNMICQNEYNMTEIATRCMAI